MGKKVGAGLLFLFRVYLGFVYFVEIKKKKKIVEKYYK